MEKENNTLMSISSEAEIEKIPRAKINIQKLFHKVSVLDYAIMWFLADKAQQADENQKFYLKDLSESSGVPLHIITEMVRKLQEKGLVIWKHDGSGEEGTYIQITEMGIQSVTGQRDILKGFHKNVIEEFGGERFLNLLREMSAFEEIMSKEIEKENEENE
ncbi:MAG: hypothetical protein ACI4RN_01985 [Oscillospiraceae bacterium]